MPRKLSRVNPLELRKNLLIAESELNRIQLAGEMAALTAGVRTLTNRAKTFGSVAALVTMLAAALKAFQRGKDEGVEAKPSWMQTVLKGAGLIFTLWPAFRAPSRRQED